MRPLPIVLALTAGLVLTGCSDAIDTATKVKDCATLATDLASSGLNRVPTQAEAEATAKKLQDRVESLDSQEVKDAASDLSSKLEALRAAAASKDAAAVQRAVEDARDSARAAAETCGIPVSQLVPGL
ncbi:MAG: hypothetical protein Q8R60_08935 [Mycobacteriales bacterium]|nr:hypothetical protein [Mycobacteriales bacterium]